MHARTPPLVLLLALLGISVAAPLVRLSEAHPLTIAAWRLGFSLVVVAGALMLTGGWRQYRRLSLRDGALASAAGVLLAVHFWSWNASIGLTSIAASVLLVNLQTVFVAGGSALLLREAPASRQVMGLGIAIGGAALVAIGSGGGTANAANASLGNALALVWAVSAAAYYLAGRSLRQRLDLWPYVGLVYGACFVALVAAAVGLSVPLSPQPPRELAIFAALALGPMLLGHTGMNWALRYLPAYVVNLTVLGEPVGAMILAALIPAIAEVPTPASIAGGALVLAGAVAAGWKSTRGPVLSAP